MTNFVAIMKHFCLVLILLVSLPLLAYNDHRNARVDSLEAALKSDAPPKGTDLLRAYDELMRGYLPYDARKTEEYGRKALALSYQLNGLSVRENALRHLGLLRYGREDFDEAIKYFTQALAVTDSMEQSERYSQSEVDDARSSLYGSIANVYNLQGKAHLAIHYYQQALPLFEKYGWLQSLSILYHNIGELYLAMGNDAEAERNFLQAIEKGEAAGDSLMQAMARKGLTKVYLAQSDYEKTSQMLQPAFDYYEAHRTEEPQGYAEVLASLARLNMLSDHRDLSKARDYAQQAAALVNDEMMFENRSDIYAACCQVAMAEERWQEALDYGLRTVHPDSLATDADADCYQLLAKIYIELGQKQKAGEMMDKMHNLMSRYATEHYQSGLSQMEVLYETEKKETQIETLARERRFYGWLLAGAGGVMALLVLLLVYRHLAHRRQKAFLAAKVALETETKERHILARDLHDSLGGMLSLLRLKMEAGDKDALPLLDKTASELRRVSHHLMPEELLRNGLSSALHDFAMSIPGAQFQSIGYTQMNQEKELVLYRCAYELVNNAMKHAQASHIDIQLMQEPRQVTLTVSDDGSGMKDTGTDGMGLQNIRERIKPYDGQLLIVSNEGKGTEIHVTIPQ